MEGGRRRHLPPSSATLDLISDGRAEIMPAVNRRSANKVPVRNLGLA